MLVYALLSGTAMMLVLSGFGWIVARLLKGESEGRVAVSKTANGGSIPPRPAGTTRPPSTKGGGLVVLY